MTEFRNIPLTEVAVGRRVTVWAVEDGHQTWGQGGVVAAVDPQLVIRAGSAGVEHRFDRDKFTADEFRIEVEEPTDPRECVNYGPDCVGEVEWFDPSGRGRGAQRCAHHRDQRAAQYENSIEKYAHSDVAPDWFDPTYAGESWNDD